MLAACGLRLRFDSDSNSNSGSGSRSCVGFESASEAVRSRPKPSEETRSRPKPLEATRSSAKPSSPISRSTFGLLHFALVCARNGQMCQRNRIGIRPNWIATGSNCSQLAAHSSIELRSARQRLTSEPSPRLFEQVNWRSYKSRRLLACVPSMIAIHATDALKASGAVSSGSARLGSIARMLDCPIARMPDCSRVSPRRPMLWERTRPLANQSSPERYEDCCWVRLGSARARSKPVEKLAVQNRPKLAQ